MQRARVAPDGMCYCPTPLQHERATVLDRYFTGIETKVIDKPVTFAARKHATSRSIAERLNFFPEVPEPDAVAELFLPLK